MPSPTELAVPYAIDHAGRLISSDTAVPHGRYQCPTCHESVCLRCPSVRRRHFAHLAHSNCSGGESAPHKIAKALVRQVLTDGLLDRTTLPRFQASCWVCREPRIPCPFPEYDRVEVEVEIKSGLVTNVYGEELQRSRVVDVALLAKDEVVGAVEVQHTHKVDESKESDLLSLRWVELKSVDVLENPSLWKPVENNWVGGTGLEEVCEQCLERYPRFEKLCERLGELREQPILRGKFRTAPIRCSTCQKGSLVYLWYGYYPDRLDELKPEQVPKSVQLKLVDPTLGIEDWVNVCAYCRTVHDDHDLDGHPGAPFWSIRLDDNCDDGLAEYVDTLSIAHCMETLGSRKFPDVAAVPTSG